MRVAAIAAILLLSSSLVPAAAQDQGQPQAQAPNQPQTPVQPERTPNQSNQSRQDDRDRAGNNEIGRDWRVRPRDGDRMGGLDQNDVGRMRDKARSDMDTEHSTVGRDWRARREDDRADRDGYGRGYYDEDRPRRRIKTCVEYENGDEYCHYR